MFIIIIIVHSCIHCFPFDNKYLQNKNTLTGLSTRRVVPAGGILSCRSRLYHQLCSACEKRRLLSVPPGIFSWRRQGQ